MQPLLLNVDWLALSVKFYEDEWRTLPEGHFYVDYDGTNVWAKRRVVYNEFNEKVATLLYHPKSTIIGRYCGLLEIANEWLYHGQSPNRIIQYLYNWRPFDIAGMSRVDLACDFNPTSSQRKIIADLADGKAYVSGKRSGSSFWSVVNSDMLADAYQGRKICHCQSWGHKTTQVKWKLYYKSKELLDSLGGKMFAKPYILDCWEQAELDKRDVWRLEVSVKAANQLDFDGQPLSFGEIKRDAVGVYRSLYGQRFIVRKNQGHKDKTNDEIVPFLPIDAGAKIRCAKAKATHRRNPAVTLLRHLLQSLESEEILLDDTMRENVLRHMEQIVLSNGLSNYFAGIVGESFWDYVESRRLLADTIRQYHVRPAETDMQSLMAAAAKGIWEHTENQVDTKSTCGTLLR